MTVKHLFGGHFQAIPKDYFDENILDACFSGGRLSGLSRARGWRASPRNSRGLQERNLRVILPSAGVFKMLLLFWKATSKLPFAGLIHIKAGKVWPGSFSDVDRAPRIHA